MNAAGRSQAPVTLKGAMMASDDARIITEAKAPFRITYVNAAWEELCGYSRDDVIGRAGLALLQACALSLPPYAGLAISRPSVILPHLSKYLIGLLCVGIVTALQHTWIQSTFTKRPNNLTHMEHAGCVLASPENQAHGYLFQLQFPGPNQLAQQSATLVHTRKWRSRRFLAHAVLFAVHSRTLLQQHAFSNMALFGRHACVIHISPSLLFADPNRSHIY
jgi:hypothetical protein